MNDLYDIYKEIKLEFYFRKTVLDGTISYILNKTLYSSVNYTIKDFFPKSVAFQLQHVLFII